MMDFFVVFLFFWFLLALLMMMTRTWIMFCVCVGLLQEAIRKAPKGLRRWMTQCRKSPVSMDTDMDGASSDEGKV